MGNQLYLRCSNTVETDERQVLVPTEGFARVFVKFPVAGTDFLPLNVALEGNFAISQERDGIAMNDGRQDSD